MADLLKFMAKFVANCLTIEVSHMIVHIVVVWAQSL